MINVCLKSPAFPEIASWVVHAIGLTHLPLPILSNPSAPEKVIIDTDIGDERR